jgi:hypothetical protein
VENEEAVGVEGGRKREVWMGLCGATVFGGIRSTLHCEEAKGKTDTATVSLPTTYMHSLAVSQYRTGNAQLARSLGQMQLLKPKT